MGCLVHVVVVGGGPEHLIHARERIAQLEQRWSRFLSSSDVSRANAAEGAAVAVAPETAELVELALAAAQRTGGAFDPTVHDAVVAAGYDRTFAEVRAGSSHPASGARAAVPAPGCAGIMLRDQVLRLPPGTRLDLGGIGKGRAADLLARELRVMGARGVCVNLGGDLRVDGTAPDGGTTWPIALEDPYEPARSGPLLGICDGAVATSSTLRRRWRTSHGTAHHLIDPRTGRPATTDLAVASIVARDALWAEVIAKCAIVMGAEAALDLIAVTGLAALLTRTDGTTIRTADFERYEPWTPSSGGTSPAHRA